MSMRRSRISSGPIASTDARRRGSIASRPKDRWGVRCCTSATLLARDALPANLRTEPLMPKEKGSPTVPFNLPNFALNSLSVRAFNYGYYAIHRNQNPRDRFLRAILFSARFDWQLESHLRQARFCAVPMRVAAGAKPRRPHRNARSDQRKWTRIVPRGAKKVRRPGGHACRFRCQVTPSRWIFR